MFLIIGMYLLSVGMNLIAMKILTSQSDKDSVLKITFIPILNTIMFVYVFICITEDAEVTDKVRHYFRWLYK